MGGFSERSFTFGKNIVLLNEGQLEGLLNFVPASLFSLKPIIHLPIVSFLEIDLYCAQKTHKSAIYILQRRQLPRCPCCLLAF